MVPMSRFLSTTSTSAVRSAKQGLSRSEAWAWPASTTSTSISGGRSRRRLHVSVASQRGWTLAVAPAFWSRQWQPGSSPPRRLYSGAAGSTAAAVEAGIVSAEIVAGGTAVRLGAADTKAMVVVPTLWLRDSCQCESCVSASSGQKRFRSSDLPDHPRTKSVSLEDKRLQIVWEDGHTSTFSTARLAEQLMAGRPFPPSLPPRKLWDRARLAQRLRPVAFRDWTAGEQSAEFWRGLADLHELGILLVEGVPESETAVLDVAHAIGLAQTTFYGETWDVVSKPEAENVAYTSEFLCLHQDLMYMHEPPHIQLLHCLRNECDGGESLFSDGVRAAWELALHHPEAAARLATLPVRYHYERGGHYYHYQRPVINLVGGDGGGSDSGTASANGIYIENTAWAPPFQDVFLPPTWPAGAEDMPSSPPTDTALHHWRRAAAQFSALIEAPENQFEVKLEPGQCVLFNNDRILHGRRQFNTSMGHRWLKGTYLSRQAFTSKVTAMVHRNGGYDGARRVGQDQGSGYERARADELAQVKAMLDGAGGD